MLIRTQSPTIVLNGITGTTIVPNPANPTDSTGKIDLDVGGGAATFSIQANVTVNANAAKVFASTAVNTTNDTATITNHSYATGVKGQLITSGSLPAGLSLSTDYFLIVLDANTVQFATTLAHALAGTAIDLTTQGTGNDTFTATALAGATVALNKSNDGVTWTNVATPTAISSTGTVWFEISGPTYRFAQLSYTLTAGSLNTSNFVLTRANQQ